MDAIAFRILPDEDLRQALLDRCVERGIEAACVLSCAGSLRRAALRYAGSRDATRIEKNLEIVSLSGTLSRHGCHLHIALSDDRGRVVGGHLLEGSRVFTTAEVVLGIVPGVVFEREHDVMTGYRELRIDDPRR